MVASVSSGANIQFQPGNYAKQASDGASKVKLDLNSVPESKVKLDISGNAGDGKGVKIDIKA